MTSINQPPAKRSRSESTSTLTSAPDPPIPTSPLDVFSSDILNKAEHYANTYTHAKPYSHGILEHLFVPGFAGKEIMLLCLFHSHCDVILYNIHKHMHAYI